MTAPCSTDRPNPVDRDCRHALQKNRAAYIQAVTPIIGPNPLLQLINCKNHKMVGNWRGTHCKFTGIGSIPA